MTSAAVVSELVTRAAAPPAASASVELITRQASFEPTTYNAEKRSVDVIFSTGAAVMRYDYEGQYMEVLDMSPEAVDMSDFIGGPVLDSHDRFSVKGILGVVDAAAVDGARGTATIRFSERSDVAEIAKDVQAGIIRWTSVGYVVREWKVSKDASGVRTKTAIKWAPRELSLVAIPADRGAKVRGDDMATPQIQPAGAPAAPPAPVNHEQQVREIGRIAGLTDDQVAGMVQRNLTPDQARTEAFDLMRQRTAPPIRNTQLVTVVGRGYDDPVFLRSSVADALYLRIDTTHKPGEAARPFIGMTVGRIAEEICRLRGIETLGLTTAGIIERALHSTSDFPLLLGDVANKTLRAMLAMAPAAIKSICRQTTIPDFRNKYSLQLGEAPALEKVGENGEFKSGTIGEGRESYKLDTYGKIFGINRQALVNDNLGAFSDIGRLFGQGAVQFEAQFLVDLITMNSGGGPKMSDTKNMFHADHGNLAASGGAISDTTLSAARLALRSQKGLDKKTPLDLAAKFLLVPAALETTAEKYLASIYPAQADNVNPFAGKLTLLVDPRLDAKSATRWYVAADPQQMPSIEWAYLAGSEGVQVETRAGFEVDGLQIRARLDFGAGALDHRGVYANAGQ
jgi:phage major head subunit gpT-like protein/phage head maturation protease